MDLLAAQRIPLEVCPTSNLRTGTLAKQLRIAAPSIRQHPLPALLRHGIPVVLSTDDPAMFHTSLADEYGHAHEMGLSQPELAQLVSNAFAFSFLLPEERTSGKLRLG